MGVLTFHKDVYIPEELKRPIYDGPLSYSGHARNVSAEGGDYAGIQLPRKLDKQAVLIEVEVDERSGQVLKQVWRQPLTAEQDICMPVISGGTVKTVWLNHRNDTHKTLRRDKFAGAFAWRKIRSKSMASSNQ